MSSQPSSGVLLIIAAPSGAGKTSLANALIKQEPNAVLTVSHTTRSQRAGESDGENYHFVDEPAFAAMVDAGAFLEHAVVFGSNYGTSRDAVEAALAAGRDLILEIDWQGAARIRSLMPQSVSVFVLPPSKATLRARLRARGRDDESVIEARMAHAVDEMSHFAEFDYVVVNDDFDTALGNLRAVLLAERNAEHRARRRHSELLEDLLSDS